MTLNDLKEVGHNGYAYVPKAQGFTYGHRLDNGGGGLVDRVAFVVRHFYSYKGLVDRPTSMSGTH